LRKAFRFPHTHKKEKKRKEKAKLKGDSSYRLSPPVASRSFSTMAHENIDSYVLSNKKGS